MTALLAIAALTVVTLTTAHSSSPSVTVKNGTYTGLYQPTYNQDLFLGIPFAQPPLGDLRLAQPASLHSTWNGAKSATAYYPECVGYGGDDIGYDVAEDCLALNVIRPAGYEGQQLPVAVWIHGGGYVMGGTPDRRYNLSFIVQNSVEIKKPMIGVSIAYRLSGWGFLDSKEIRDAGATNIGMYDQRLALQWIQENIAAFGGDPSKVTIWGESAGAGSVGIHLIAFGGRDDKLFRGAIAESGNSILLGTTNYNVSVGQAIYDNITAATGCSSSTDTLACLKRLPFDTLNTALNITPSYSFFPYPDNGLIQASQADQLNSGKFVPVPLLLGSNTDEGTAFGPRGINNDSDFSHYLSTTSNAQLLTKEQIDILEVVYPNLPAVSEVLYELPLSTTFNTTFGTQYRRAVAFGGDFTFTAARRLQCQSWSTHNVPAYCYRFNAIPYPLSPYIAATHFQEVAFVFNNLQGLGYAANPFQNKPQTYAQLSKLMSRMWVGFVSDGDPNAGAAGLAAQQWPVYNATEGGGVGYDYFFDPAGSHAELDNYRGAGVAYLNTLWKDVYGK